MLEEDSAIDQGVSVFESPEDKRDSWLLRSLRASATRVDLRLAELYREASDDPKYKVTLKPSCGDRGATGGQSKCRPKS